MHYILYYYIVVALWQIWEVSLSVLCCFSAKVICHLWQILPFLLAYNAKFFHFSRNLLDPGNKLLHPETRGTNYMLKFVIRFSTTTKNWGLDAIAIRHRRWYAPRLYCTLRKSADNFAESPSDHWENPQMIREFSNIGTVLVYTIMEFN